MRFRFLILAALVAALGVSAATAAPTKGKPAPAGCKLHAVELGGLFTAAGDNSFTMSVKRSNQLGRGYKKAGSATVNVDDKTKMKRNGKPAKLSDLVAGDRVLVLGRACRSDLKDGATPPLLARRVWARAAKPAASSS